MSAFVTQFWMLGFRKPMDLFFVILAATGLFLLLRNVTVVVYWLFGFVITLDSSMAGSFCAGFILILHMVADVRSESSHSIMLGI